MEYTISALIIVSLMLCYYQNSLLKNRIKELEQRLNQLAVNTDNEELALNFVSSETKELIMHLKRSGKEVEAVKRLRQETGMSLLDAKQYVDHID